MIGNLKIQWYWKEHWLKICLFFVKQGEMMMNWNHRIYWYLMTNWLTTWSSHTYSEWGSIPFHIVEDRTNWYRMSFQCESKEILLWLVSWKIKLQMYIYPMVNQGGKWYWMGVIVYNIDALWTIDWFIGILTHDQNENQFSSTVEDRNQKSKQSF